MKKIILLLVAGACGLIWAQTNVLTQPPAQPTVINADSADFDLNIKRAVYRGHVEVTDPKVKLNCEWLVVDFPSDGGHLSHVSAETNVVIDFTDEKGATYHVTSAMAVYTYQVVNLVTNEIVTFTGSPRVETTNAIITSEPMVWDRGTGHFLFTNPHMVSRQNLNGGGSGTNASPLKLY